MIRLIQRRILAATLLICAVSLCGCRSANSRKLAYVESGKQYEHQGKPREAAIQFSNAVRIDPSYADGHYLLSKAYRESGSTRLAIYELGLVLQLRPEDMQARLDIGELLLQTGQAAAASDQARWVAFKQPANAAAQALVSATAIALGNTVEAQRSIRSAIALAPGKAEYHASLGQLLAADPKSQAEALTELQTAIRLDAKNLQARYALAGIFERRGDLKNAVEQMRLATNLAPDSVEARGSLAALYLRTGDRSSAEQTLQKTTEDLPNDPAAAPLLERFYQATGQMSRAQPAYEALVQRHPNSLSLQLAYIRVLVDRGAYDKARSIIQDLSQKHGTDPDVNAMQAYMLMHDGQNDAALDILQTAAKNEPDNEEIAVLLGTAQARSGNRQEAAASFHKALAINAKSIDAQRGLADMAYRDGDSSGLREAARQMLLLHPELADGYLWKGMASLRDHQIAAAIPDLEEAVRREPANSFALVQLGLARESQGDLPKARALFEQALQAAPDASAIAALTQMDIRSNQPAAAVARVQQQIQRAPSSSELYDELAKAQLAAQDTAAAAGSAQHAMQLDPANRDAMQTFTQVELSAGQLGPPVDMWRRWGADHPADPEAPAALGMLYESAGDSKTAQEFYRQSLSIRPDQPEVSAALALLQAEAGGNLDVALSMAQAAYRQLPTSSGTADAVGWIYYRKGLPSSGLGPLQSAATIDATDASIQYHLGVVQARLGNKAEAITHLKRAQDLAGGTSIATKAQDELQKFR